MSPCQTPNSPSVLNHLDKGNVFDRAKTLRDRMHLPAMMAHDLSAIPEHPTNGAATEYQVTHQVSQEGTLQKPL